MKLNLDKCINITTNQKTSTIKFRDGKLVPRKQQATYLGTIISQQNSNRIEIDNRIADCNAQANKLRLFWNKAKSTIRWKLIVFDAIIRSKLLYGLEAMQASYMPPCPRVAHVNALSNSGVTKPLYSGHVNKIPSAAVSLAFNTDASGGKLVASIFGSYTGRFREERSIISVVAPISVATESAWRNSMALNERSRLDPQIPMMCGCLSERANCSRVVTAAAAAVRATVVMVLY